MGDAMVRLGAVPTSFDSTEVYSGMERGTIDAVSLPITVSFAAFRIYEVSKWLTTNLALGTTSAALFGNAEAIEKLPPQYRALLDEAREAGYEAYRKGYGEEDKKNYPLFKARGIQLVEYSEAELAEIRRIAAEPVWEEWVRQQEAAGRPGRAILDIALKAAKPQ
jgi:TRAP-type C4-dicarboxylate transport system substrate-binding protein